MKTRKTRKRKNPPTPAQLRARAKFVKGVRSGAFRKKKANPGKRGLAGATAHQQRQYEEIKKSERRSGKPLAKAKSIAAATVRKRAGNKTVIKARKVKIMASNPKRKRNPLTPRDREQLLSINRLIRSLQGRISKSKDPMERKFLRSQLIELRGSQYGLRSRKRNPSVTPKSKSNFERFHGRASRKTLNLVAPDGTPKSLSINGPLHKLITRKVTVPFYKVRKRNPGGTVFLAESDDGGLHIVAQGMGLPVGPPNTDFGPIEKVEYDMPDGKIHLGYNEPTGFVHKFGEDGGEKPHLETNDKGEYLITGGDYYITERGIENPRRRKRRLYR